jgi:hypothetical protein
MKEEGEPTPSSSSSSSSSSKKVNYPSIFSEDLERQSSLFFFVILGVQIEGRDNNHNHEKKRNMKVVLMRRAARHLAASVCVCGAYVCVCLFV